MNFLYLQAAVSGLLFGCWPLFMKHSGLNGNVASACFSSMSLIGVLPFMVWTIGFKVPEANWKLVGCAGLCGAVGLLIFNGMLTRATKEGFGTLFVIVNLTQVAVAATYQSYMDGRLPPQKIGGYTLAFLATYLLAR